jgi:hypothetical protein
MTRWPLSEIENMEIDELAYWVQKAAAFQERISPDAD